MKLLSYNSGTSYLKARQSLGIFKNIIEKTAKKEVIGILFVSAVINRQGIVLSKEESTKAPRIENAKEPTEKQPLF